MTTYSEIGCTDSIPPIDGGSVDVPISREFAVIHAALASETRGIQVKIIK